MVKFKHLAVSAIAIIALVSANTTTRAQDLGSLLNQLAGQNSSDENSGNQYSGGSSGLVDLIGVLGSLPSSGQALNAAEGGDGTAKNSCGSVALGAAVLGGLLYSKGDGKKTLGAALGAGALGAIVCNAIRINGVKKEDTTEVATATGALMTNKGQTQTTVTTKSGSTYQVSGSETFETEIEEELALVEGVQAPQAGSKVVGKIYFVLAQSLNLRSGPGTHYSSTGSFSEGDYVLVNSISPDGNWALLSSAGVGVGYVSTSLIQAASSNVDVARLALPQPPKTSVATSGASSKKASTQTASAAPKVKTQKVKLATQCKTITVGKNKPQNQCGKSDGGYQWG